MVESTQTLRRSVSVGDSFPWHASASARAVLAQLDTDTVDRMLGDEPLCRFTSDIPATRAELDEHLAKTRLDGYDVCDDEFEANAWAVATPIIATTGVVGSLTLSAPGQRLSPSDRAAAIQAVTEEARRLSKMLAST